MPLVEAGELTKMEAMIKAGYAESSAREQSAVLGSLGSNTRMQQALRKKGFTEEYLAEGVMEGTRATEATKQPVKTEEGTITTKERADYRTRGIYYKLGAQLLDAFPAQKKIGAQVGVEQILDNVEQSTDYAEWDTANEQKPEEEKSDS